MNKKIPDYIFPILISIMMAVLLKPMVIDGLVPQGVDVLGSKGQTHQIKEFKSQTGEKALYNPYLFGGMPIYFRIPPEAVSIDTLFSYLGKFLNNTFLWYIFGGTGMFLLLRFLGLSQLPSFFGGLAFVLFPHYQALWAEGHFMKFRAVMIIPWVCFTTQYFFRKPHFVSMGLFALTWGIQIRTQHYQIVFYTALLIFVLGMVELVKWYKLKNWKTISTTALLTFLGVFLAILTAIQPLFLAREYLPYSTRGAHTINLNQLDENDHKSDGVDLNYATNWSTHPFEMAGWFFPHYFGGLSGLKYSGDSYPSLRGKTIPGYWGYMPFTQSYEYMGPLIIFLLIFALVSFRNVSLIIGFYCLAFFLILLSFGKHFESFYSVFFSYVPFFNKFRAPMMSVTMTYFLFVVIASVGLNELLKKTHTFTQKKLYWIISILVGIGAISWFLSNGFTFSHKNDAYNAETLRIIQGIRIELFQDDIFRYFLLLGLIFGVVLCYLLKKINRHILAISFIGILAFDFINVQQNKHINFLDIHKLEKKNFKKTALDQYLLNDKSEFRIFPVGKLFGTNQWSYYHQSIGGYSSVKMNGIQEIISNNLYHSSQPNIPFNVNVVKMMNVKYVISRNALKHPSLVKIPEVSGTSLYTYRLNDYLSRGYYVHKVKLIPDGEERLSYLNHPGFSPHDEVILEKEIQDDFAYSEQNTGKLHDFKPGHLEWDLHSETTSIFVISESYYKPGWKAYLNEKQIPILKANHLHMAVIIPKGNHKLTLTFEPESFYQYAMIEKSVLYSIYIFLLFHLAYKNREKLPYFSHIK